MRHTLCETDSEVALSRTQPWFLHYFDGPKQPDTVTIMISKISSDKAGMADYIQYGPRTMGISRRTTSAISDSGIWMETTHHRGTLTKQSTSNNDITAASSWPAQLG